MKLAITANDRTYSIQIPWWLVLAALFTIPLWQPAAAWASHTFSDVSSSHIFHDDIQWMADAGVTKGCNPPANDEYCPEDVVTRGQMAAFMRRFASDVATGNSDPEVESRLASLESAVSAIQSGLDALESGDAAQQGEIDALEGEVDALEGEVDALEGEVDAVQSLLAGVTRSGDVLRFSGMNLQVVNGTDTTDGTPNGLGNLIVGYDAPRTSGSDKSGSHYLVVGDEHNYTAFGGILAGFRNTASGDWASVTGGTNNTASGSSASVSGGLSNTASGIDASVSGGSTNSATSNQASVSGGRSNDATSSYASISGGYTNTASGNYASVSGGSLNTASGHFASILGGQTETVSTNYACHPSCV